MRSGDRNINLVTELFRTISGQFRVRINISRAALIISHSYSMYRIFPQVSLFNHHRACNASRNISVCNPIHFIRHVNRENRAKQYDLLNTGQALNVDNAVTIRVMLASQVAFLAMVFAFNKKL